MKLYLVQHAKAAPKQVDPQRSLTEDGRRDMQKVTAFIKPLNLSVNFLWHSGKKRAVQTAEALAEVIEIKQAEIARDGLAPNDDVTVLRDELASARQDVMIVGHLPFLSKLASLLLAGSESTEAVAFKQGGIVCLSCSETNQWQIDWMVTPELLV
jgi:phosphohistidine phosphatase